MDQYGNFCTNSDDINLILALKSPSEFTLQNGSSKFLPYFRSENWRHGSFLYIFYYFNLMFPNFSVL